jgi:dTDP-4-amino-4,6-dideoxygalactose transaminase
MDNNIVKGVAEYLRSGQPLSIDGATGIVASFEAALREYFGHNYALLFNSGTSALHAAYFALNLPRRARIACPVYTYPATVMPMLNLGLVPIFCDADPVTANVSPSSLTEALNLGARAIVVTHMWGLPCDMMAIQQLAQAHSVPIIEDLSHAPGATVRGRLAGTFGDAAVISLQAFKLIWAGEGGVLLTSKREVFERAVIFGHNQQRIVELGPESPYSDYSPYGYGLKLRIHPLAAVIGLHALRKLPAILQQQRMKADILDTAFEESTLARAPVRLAHTERAYYTYKPLLRTGAKVSSAIRPKLVNMLRAIGIPARVPDSGPLCEHPIFRERLGGMFGATIPRLRPSFPGAFEFFNKAITIPFPNAGGLQDVKRITELLRGTIREVSKIMRTGTARGV